MKRWLSILAVLGCIVALPGCKNEAEQAYFNAKVLEVNKEYVDVRCIEAFNSGISVDEEFSVTKDVVSAGGDRKSTRLNSSHDRQSRMPSSA